MDLGSAILSAGMALEFATADTPVRLSDAPFVEGLIAAVVVAGSGATLDAVDAEARRALGGKAAQLEGSAGAASEQPANQEGPVTGGADASFTGIIRNPSGLHARPAAVFVKTVGRHDAAVTVTDLGTGKGPASGASLISLMSLGVAQGARVRIDATGPDAAGVIGELERLIVDGFGEV
jgi:phosphotransferase system HPr (HPr) family protein